MEVLLFKTFSKTFSFSYEFNHMISLHCLHSPCINFSPRIFGLIKFTFEMSFQIEIYVALCISFQTQLSKFAICLVVNCSDPGIPGNSKRESKIEHGNFTYGTVVFYDCNPGYFLFGSSVLICQPNGQWDKPLPECISK